MLGSLTKEYVRPGQVVIDVSINWDPNKVNSKGFPPISGVGPELQNRPLSIQTDFSGRGCGRGPKFLLFHMLNERRYAICLI